MLKEKGSEEAAFVLVQNVFGRKHWPLDSWAQKGEHHLVNNYLDF